MDIQLRPSTLVILSWSAERGRTYDYSDESAPACVTCATDGSVPWSDTCSTAGHTRRDHWRAVKTERAPLEGKRVQQLYTRAQSAMRAIGHDLGRAIYLVPRAADLTGALDTIQAEIAAANAEFTACRAVLDAKLLPIDPSTAHASTLASLRADVERTIGDLLAALAHATETGPLRAAIRESRNLAAVVDRRAARQIGDLQNYMASVADRLRAAAREGDAAIEIVTTEAKSGAARFAAVFAGRAEVDTAVRASE